MSHTSILVSLLLLTGCAKPGVLIVRDARGLSTTCISLGAVTDGTLVGGPFGSRVGEGPAAQILVEMTRAKGGSHVLIEGPTTAEAVPNVGTAYKCPPK